MRLALVGVLLACSSSSSSNVPERTPSGGADATTAARPGTPDAPSGGRTLKIERQLPDDGWQRAADAALVALRPWAESDPSHARLVLRPLAAPDGSTLEHLLHYETFTADGRSAFASRVLVANGALVDKPDPKAATEYLRGRGFPKTKIDRGLLYEVLNIYGVVGVGWVPLPSQAGWPALDTSHTTGEHVPVQLVYDGGGATLTLVRTAPDYTPATGRLVDRLVIRFDTRAKITLTSAREQVDGSWKPIPSAP